MGATTELVISEITIMTPGFCVIGLQAQEGAFCSLRPMPPRGHAWLDFRYQRGDRLRFRLARANAARPHVEDRISAGVLERTGPMSEIELVDCLRRAEKAGALHEFFGCSLCESPFGGNAVWADPGEATRSICGCPFTDIQFRVYADKIRVALSLPWGEVLRSLPLVDRDWNSFLLHANRRIHAGQSSTRLEGFLNGALGGRILESPIHFARIGIARADERGCCWLMLDSLFPQPSAEWLKDLG